LKSRRSSEALGVRRGKGRRSHVTGRRWSLIPWRSASRGEASYADRIPSVRQSHSQICRQTLFLSGRLSGENGCIRPGSGSGSVGTKTDYVRCMTSSQTTPGDSMRDQLHDQAGRAPRPRSPSILKIGSMVDVLRTTSTQTVSDFHHLLSYLSQP